jgi:hypothetical protein
MVKDVVFVACQVRVDVCPALIDAGLAVNVTVGAGGGGGGTTGGGGGWGLSATGGGGGGRLHETATETNSSSSKASDFSDLMRLIALPPKFSFYCM